MAFREIHSCSEMVELIQEIGFYLIVIFYYTMYKLNTSF